MDVRGGVATLAATDLEASIKVTVECDQADEDGCVLLPAEQMSAILSVTPDRSLSLDCDGNRVQVRGERTRHGLLTDNPQDYPAVDTESDGKFYTVKAGAFCEGIKRAAASSADNSSRFTLDSVYLDISESEVCAVGTDGAGMTVQKIANMPSDGYDPCAAIIPASSAKLLGNVFSGGGDVEVSVSENAVFVRNENAAVRATLLQGRYPKWMEVIPGGKAIAAFECVAGVLLEAIRQADICSKQGWVTLSIGDGTLVVSSIGESGDAEVRLPVSCADALPPVTYQPHLICNALRLLKRETIIYVGIHRDRNNNKVLKMTADGGWTFVLMPSGEGNGHSTIDSRPLDGSPRYAGGDGD
jgi:DNA polymerase-3 subunit beta